MKIVVSFFIFILLSSSFLSFKKWKDSNPSEYQFEHYKIEFNKTYKSESENKIRELLFKEALKKVNEINSNPKYTWKATINHLSDRIPSELKSLMGINRDISFFNYKKSNFQISQDFLQNLPKNVDWRERGITTPVKDQGSCGSCWAFATSAVLESHISLQNEGKSVIVSPQELVDCVNNDQKCGGTGGCNGATQELGFKYIEQNGISSLSNYPYFAKEGKCNSENVKKSAKIGSFVKLPENDYNALMQSVATIGPIAISVAASEWSFYDSGVFNGFCGTEVNHVVALEGYGTDENGNDYWLVRNSWSENWGENGYIRIYREKSAKDVTCDIDSNPNAGNGCEGGPSEISVCGLCGILSDAAYPVNARLIDN